MAQNLTMRESLNAHALKAMGLALVLACAWPQAQAQVNRCSDANGNVTYTDASCPSHLESVEIQAAKTPEQIAIEQERAAQALEMQAQQRLDRLQEQRLQAETAALEASARASAAAEAAARAQTTNYANTPACQDATRQLNRYQSANGRYTSEEQLRLERAQDAADRACLSPQDYAALQREKALRPNTTIVINPPYWGQPAPNYPWQPTPPGLPPVTVAPPGPPAIPVPPIMPMPPKPPVVMPPAVTPPVVRPPVLTPQKPPSQSGMLRTPARQEPDTR